MTWITDSHIHLSDPEYDTDFCNIINSMQNLHLKACCVSMDLETSQKSLELGKKSNFILPFLGIHPEKAQENIESVMELINQNQDKISGIGEIGLDKTYVNSDDAFKTQKHVFFNIFIVSRKDAKTCFHSFKKNFR